MAFTGTVVKNDAFGGVRVAILDVTADALSGGVAAGVGTIYAYSLGPVSMATAGITCQINQNAAASSIAGNLHFSGCVSGDHFFVTLYAKS